MIYTYVLVQDNEILLCANESGLCGVYNVGQKYQPALQSGWQHAPDNPLFIKVHTQLSEYFQNKRTTFDIPLSFCVGTDFQQQVWKELLTIPHGETVSYQYVANAIKKPRGVRAVAGAIGRNPLSIIIPCHRVIGKNGSLTGYAGGIGRKKTLLILEQSKK